MTPQQLFDLAAEFAEATGNTERWQTRAASTADDNERAAHTAMAETWRALVIRRREDLRTALRETHSGTVRAVPADELPAATWQYGRSKFAPSPPTAAAPCGCTTPRRGPSTPEPH
jgi:hypothetical protein